MWKQKDGKEISIKDMSTSHIENAIGMMDKCIARAQNRSYECDGEIYLPDDFIELYNALCDELESRKIAINVDPYVISSVAERQKQDKSKRRNVMETKLEELYEQRMKLARQLHILDS